MLTVINSFETLINNIYERKKTRIINIGYDNKIWKFSCVLIFQQGFHYNIFFNKYSDFESKKIKKHIDSIICKDISKIIFDYVDEKYELKMMIQKDYSREKCIILIKYITDNQTDFCRSFNSKNYLFCNNHRNGKCSYDYNDMYNTKEYEIGACTYVINKITKKIISDFNTDIQNAQCLGL